jgi:glycosyltransferase involved in cell wall biosynthesis
VGRLEQAKGIELLLSTWKSLPDFFQLSIIGEGTDAARLAKEYNQPNIAFLGQLPHDEVIKKMKNVKYLLHTSLAFETFGLTLIEAFSQGTPVIGLARGTRLELIENEKNGFICEPEKLKETILNSYDYAGYEQLSINATRKSREFFLDNVMSKQIALYKEFI